jgi:hypothetical protein
MDIDDAKILEEAKAILQGDHGPVSGSQEGADKNLGGMV